MLINPLEIGHSPHILIYLEVDGKTIRLADVLHNTATLFEEAELPSNTQPIPLL